MKRKNDTFIHDDNISLDKKVKIKNEMKQSLQDIYQNSKECNSIMSFSEYIDYFNNYLKYRNSDLFKSLPIDLLLQINNFIEINEKLTMIYVCKNWFEKFYNNDYFWKYLLSLLKIENINFDTNQIRNFLIFKYKYYNYFKKEERRFMECSSDNSILSNFNENSIPLKFNDNFYFNGEFKYYSGWYGCGGGSTISNFQTNLFGIYFEPLSLQHIFVKLEINIDYDDGREKSNNTEFSLVVYKIGDDKENIKKLKRRKKIINDDDSSDSDISENEEEKNMKEEEPKKKRIIKKKQDFSSDDDEEEEIPKSLSVRKKVEVEEEEEEDEEEETPKRERKNEKETMLNVFYLDYKHKFYVFNEELRKLVREWLKLSENDVKNEKDWLKEFLENKIPKEANCKEIFNYWPLLK
ncbi:hypothetical protein ABK040_013299 [Willaertia magna]